MGLTVDIATAGEEALEAAGRTHYGAILLDLQLPDMNGTQVLRRLREGVGMSDECPVVITTAGATDAEHRRCHELGAERVLTKPVDAHELRTILAQWLQLETSATAGDKTPTDPEMINIYLRESDHRMISIRKAPMDEEGRLRIAREAHTLVSTSHYMRDTALPLVARRVEGLARDGETKALEAAIRDLILAYGKLRKRLRDQLAASEMREQETLKPAAESGD